MRAIAWLIGILFMIGCDRPSVSRPVAAVAPVVPEKAAGVARPAVLAPVQVKSSASPEPIVETPTAVPPLNDPLGDPLKSPGADYVWIRPCLKSDGTEIAGFWKRLARMPKPKPEVTSPPREVVSRQQPAPRAEVTSTSEKTWVDGHWRKTKSGRTWVDGYWRKK